MRFARVVLQVGRETAEATRRFYLTRLGLTATGDDGVRIGETEMTFRVSRGEPFYHFALLVPGDRFDAAREWAADRVDLLPGGDIDDFVFDFDNWHALALYFHDPAGNIVELIAHAGIEENGRAGALRAAELVGVSELGLVGDQGVLAPGLDGLGIPMWEGAVEPGRLAFFGERARTLIVAPPGRGWLPTGRPAEPHPVEATIVGETDAEATLGSHRVVVLAS